MVGGDETFSAEIKKFRNDSRATFVHRLNGLDAGFDNSSVTNHIGVREIQNDQIVIGHARENFIGDFVRAHFRLQIVGGDFG